MFLCLDCFFRPFIQSRYWRMVQRKNAEKSSKCSAWWNLSIELLRYFRIWKKLKSHFSTLNIVFGAGCGRKILRKTPNITLDNICSFKKENAKMRTKQRKSETLGVQTPVTELIWKIRRRIGMFHKSPQLPEYASHFPVTDTFFCSTGLFLLNYLFQSFK